MKIPDNGPVATSSTRERILRALKDVPLFEALDESSRIDLARCARLSEVEAGQVVIERGEPAQALYAVQHGRLKVVAPRVGARDATLHILRPGDVFGEVALFQEGGRTARVTALESALLLVIDRRDFLWLIDRTPDLSRRMLSLLAGRLQHTIEHFDATTSLEVHQRLARKLLALADVFGTAGPDGQTSLALPLSQSELADLIDSSRQTVNRLLKAWKDEGTLRVDGRSIVLLDLDGLRRCAGLG